MPSDIEKFLQAEDSDRRPLIISGCLHGVTESWGFKDYLTQNIRGADKFNIIARGAQPENGPKMEDSTKRVVGVELKVEEISRAVLVLIHHTKLGHYRQRFGSEALTQMERIGYLEVRQDPRFWNIKKSPGEKKQKYEKMLAELRDKPQLGQVHARIIELLTENDIEYKKKKDLHKKDWKKKRRS